MIRAIIWKEWRKERRLFFVFLLGSVALPPILTEFFPGRPEFALWQLGLFWAVYSAILGSIFVGENRQKTIPFLLARPATKPVLFCEHYLSRMAILAVLVAVSLFSFCVYGAIQKTGLSALAVLFNPYLAFELAICVSLISLSILVDSSLLTFGWVLPAVALFLIALWPFLLPDTLISILSLISRVHMPSPTETPTIFLLILACATATSSTLCLWEICFDEIRDRRNRRWIFACIIMLTVSLALLFPTTKSIATATRTLDKITTFEEVIVRNHANMVYPLLAIAADNRGSRFLLGVRGPDTYQRIERFQGKGMDYLRVLKKLREDERVASRTELSQFYTARSNLAKAFGLRPIYPSLVYFSEKPLWGQEIRVLDRFCESKMVLPKDYSRNEKLGLPYLSPDEDRIAYLKTSKSRFRNNSYVSLCIVKLDGNFLRGEVRLAEDASTSFEPIGWTPDGYDFMMRKIGPQGPEIWAVDWAATGVRRFLPEFSDAIITEDDLPKRGEWISLVQKAAGGEYTLWAVNCGTCQAY